MRTFFVLDFETTGPNPEVDEPVSVAVAKLSSTGPEIVVDRLVSPSLPISEGAARIHGITEDRVKDAPPWSEVARDLAGLFSPGDVVICYNATFDGIVFLYGCERAMIEAPPVEWWCPLVWARDLWWGRRGAKPAPTDPETGKTRLRLEDLARFFGVEHDAHDAKGDVLATAAILSPLRSTLSLHLSSLGVSNPFTGSDVLAISRYTREKGEGHERFFADLARRDGKTPEASRWAKLAAT